MRKKLVVGDIHGCYHELMARLAKERDYSATPGIHRAGTPAWAERCCFYAITIRI